MGGAAGVSAPARGRRPAGGSAPARGRPGMPDSPGASLRLAPEDSARGEDLDGLLAVRLEVVGLAAGHERVRAGGADLDLLIGARAAGVADVGLEARPGRERAAAYDAGLHECPRRMADRRHRLARLEEAADELDGLLLRPEVVGGGDPAGQ